MTSTGDAVTECPKCGYQQDGGEECLRCGVVFAKARGTPPLDAGPDPTARRSTGRPHPIPASRPGSGSRSDTSALLTWLLVAVGLMAFWLWWSGASEPEPLLQTFDEAPSAAVEPISPSPAAPEPRRERRSEPPERGAGIAPDRGWESGTEWREESREEPAPFRQPVVTFLWHEGAPGYRRAIEEQAGTHQPLLVYFYTDWCGYCRQLDRELLTDFKAEDYLRHLIKVKINPEDGPREREIAQSFGVTGYPSLFAKGYGRGRFLRIPASFRRGSRVHVLTPEQFVATLRRATGYESG